MTALATEDDPRLVYVPIEDGAKPKNGLCESYVNNWWAVHPTRGLIFWRASRRVLLSPQCNANESVARHITAKLWPFAEVRQIPAVHVRANPRDYA